MSGRNACRGLDEGYEVSPLTVCDAVLLQEAFYEDLLLHSEVLLLS